MQDGNRSWDERKKALQIKTDYVWQKWLKLAEICALNNLVNCGSLLQHLCIPKITWESHNGRDKNKNDHVTVNGRYRRSIMRCHGYTWSRYQY